MKKVLALALVLVMAVGMSTTAFAATYKIKGVGEYKGEVDFGDGVRADSEFFAYIPLEAIEYDGTISAGTAPTAALQTKKVLTSGSIGIKASFTKGSKWVDKVELADAKTIDAAIAQGLITAATAGTTVPAATASVAHIKLAIVDPLVTTGDNDVEVKVNFTHKGSRKTGVEMILTCNVENEVVEVDSDTVFEISDGQTLEALANIRNIEIDIGNNVSVWTNLTNGKKYFGATNLDWDEADEEVGAKYPTLDNVINLLTIGLNGATAKVDLSYYDGFVYDKDLNYLGKTSEKLAYSTKYYLFTEQLPVAEEGGDDAPDEVEEELPEDTGDLDNAETGGDGSFSNANDNPGTGR